MSNAAFPIFLGAVVIDSSNKAIRVTEGGVTETLNLVEGTYFVRGDGSADDLVEAFTTALATHSGGNTYTTAFFYQQAPTAPSVTLTIDRTGANTFAVLFANAATTFDATLLGFAQTNQSAAVQQVSTLSSSAVWLGNDVYRSLEIGPSYERHLSRAFSGKTHAVSRRTSQRDRLWVQEYIEERRFNEEAISADPDRALSQFLARHAGGLRFEFRECSTFFSSDNGGQFQYSDTSSVGTFVFSDDFYPANGQFGTRTDGAPLYAFQGLLLPYVA